MPDIAYIVFVFMLGSCVGSFLNVVVWRLPRTEYPQNDGWFRALWRPIQGLSNPPSHCPKCDKLLKWYDNIPILGWIKLGGKCRFCKEPISIRYPIVETITALIFVFYYVMFYYAGYGPCAPVRQALFVDALQPVYVHVDPSFPTYFLYVFLASTLLAASLIDAELFIIPASIPWTVTVVGLVYHAMMDHPTLPGALNAISPTGGPSPSAALAAGGIVGLVLSLGLKHAGLLPVSFSQGDPLMDFERRAAEKGAREATNIEDVPPPEGRIYTPQETRREMRKEMMFLMPPMGLAVGWFLLTQRVAPLHAAWLAATRPDWVTGLLGALFGGLVGAFVVWAIRISGSIAFGREAMGMGDVDLMFGVGTVLGAGAATVAFFLAPFFGIVLALYMLFTRRGRELPYGPYLSLASGFVMLYYCPIADWLSPGLAGLAYFVADWLGPG